MWKMTCDKGESEVEACNPKLDQDGAPAGVSGVMLTGLA